MNTITIIGLASVGVAATVGEKVLNNMGKADMANWLSLAGLSAIGIGALAGVVKLFQVCKTL